MRRWRWSFLATAGQFGYADGSEWGVSHYRLKMRSPLPPARCRGTGLTIR